MFFAVLFFTQSVFAEQGRIVVAKSGGDFVTINEALAQGSSCSNPTVIDVMPGVYNETLFLTGNNACTHLRGAGSGLTTIQGTGSAPVIKVGIQCAGCGTPGTILVSGVTIKGAGSEGGISAAYTSMTVADSRITNNSTGVSINYGTLTVKGSKIDNNSTGAYQGYGTLRLESNIIENNSSTGIYGALYVVDNLIMKNGKGVTVRSQPNANHEANISGNTITNNDYDGMYLQSYGTIVIKNNKITGNGVVSGRDITCVWRSNDDTTLAFNTFDTIQAANCTLAYNIKSDGTPF